MESEMENGMKISIYTGSMVEGYHLCVQDFGLRELCYMHEVLNLVSTFHEARQPWTLDRPKP